MIVKAYNHTAPLDLQIDSLRAQIRNACERLERMREWGYPTGVLAAYNRTIWIRCHRLSRLLRRMESN